MPTGQIDLTASICMPMGNKIEFLKNRSGLKWSEIAKMADISRNYLYELKEEKKPLTGTVRQRLAEIFDCRPEEIGLLPFEEKTATVSPLPPREEKIDENSFLYMAAKLSILAVANSHRKFIPEAEIEEFAAQLYKQVQDYRNRGKQEEPSELAAELLMKQKGYL